jgi:NADH-quinone oxidoreductase subunit G
LGDETGIDSAGEALAAIASDVPFYAGITEEEIGGLGVRWQDRTAAARLPDVHVSRAREPSLAVGAGKDRLQVGTYRDLWAAEVTDRAPALRFLRPKQTLEISPADAERLGLAGTEEVDVRQNGTSVHARLAIRERVRPGSAFLVDGLGDGAGALAREPVEITPVLGSE